MTQLRVIELLNRHGDSVRLLNLGARLCSLQLQLRSGPRNVVLGYPDVNAYVDEPNFMGCTVGRFGNRIAHASFSIDGKQYRLSANDGKHHLHGGADGFDRRLWAVADSNGRDSVIFELQSPHGDQGYPGDLRATARYDWDDQRQLTITYSAETDARTHVNLTSHAYFNLDGDSRDIRQHTVRIASDRIVAVDADMIPVGTLLNVHGSVLDLRQPTCLAHSIDSENAMIDAAGGIDFSYVLDSVEDVATAWSRERDLRMSLQTSCPALHLYTGQNLVRPMQRFAGFCMEPQYFPDTPNHMEFPESLLQPGERFLATTRYRFAEEAIGE
jgi:aldose 1-epimerase